MVSKLGAKKRGQWNSGNSFDRLGGVSHLDATTLAWVTRVKLSCPREGKLAMAGRRTSVIDSLFAEVNAQYDHDLVPVLPKHDQDTNKATLLGWNVVTQGATMNKQDEEVKQRARQAGNERRKLKELQAQLQRERRTKEKTKRREIAEYEKALLLLKRKEALAKGLRRPIRGEHAGDAQRRRHEFAKMLLGDFTSLERPAVLTMKNEKVRLEPVLQHWLPQFKEERPTTQQRQEVHEGNMRRHKNVKKAIQRQRWVKMLNSTNFSTNQMVNMDKIRAKNSNKLGTLTGLMKQQNYSTNKEDSLGEFVVKQAKEAEREKKGAGTVMDVDMRMAIRNRERKAMGVVGGFM